jgi:hypothetical protein
MVLIMANSGARAIQIHDDFSSGVGTWIAGPGWSLYNPTPGFYYYRADHTGTGETLTWKNNWPLDSSWRFEADLLFQSVNRDGGLAGTGSLALSANNVNPSVKLLADVVYSPSGALLIEVAYLTSGGSSYTPLSSGWRSGALSSCHAKLEHTAGSDRLNITVTCTNGFSYSADTSPIGVSFLNSLSTPGFRVGGATVDFSNLSITSPITVPGAQNDHHRSIAANAVNDLLNHFWVGDAKTGQIANTWYGYTNQLPDARGGLWERGTMFFALENLSRLTGDITLAQRLKSDWNRTKAVYTAQQLEGCGQDSGTSWASDDAGWTALMYLTAYRATGDPYALDRARGLVACAFNRWLDDQEEGGLWYSDARQVKSLYQAALVLDALRIYQLTEDEYFYGLALKSYTWIERHLLRSDGLYWTDYGTNGPIYIDRPYDIHEAGSVTFIGGNMAMGVVHATLYRMAGEDEYRLRALRTADALPSHLVDPNGVYIDDRDAWADGTFAGEWAREVLTLPGISTTHWNTLRATADAIYTKDRTPDGYYGGAWDGPADGPDSPWSNAGSKPQQIMTSANAVNMMVAAAILENQTQQQLKPAVSVSGPVQQGQFILAVSGARGWNYLVESTFDLKSWTTTTNFLSDGAQKAFQISAAGSHQQFYRAALAQ